MHVPPMTHELGRYWEAPPCTEILIDDQYALMSRLTFDKLLEYSTSYPSGVYEGKMWRARVHDGWALRWYENAGENLCHIFSRSILILE